MRRTNTKQVKEAIIKMIMENATVWVNENREYFAEDPKRKQYAGIDPTNRATFPQLCDLILSQFYIEKVENDNRWNAGRTTRQELFEDWARGLTSAIPSDFWTYHEDPRDILGDILEQTEAERKKYTEEESALLLTRLIYREIVGHATK